MPSVLFQFSVRACTTCSVLDTAFAHQLNWTAGKPLPSGKPASASSDFALSGS